MGLNERTVAALPLSSVVRYSVYEQTQTSFLAYIIHKIRLYRHILRQYPYLHAEMRRGALENKHHSDERLYWLGFRICRIQDSTAQVFLWWWDVFPARAGVIPKRTPTALS
jgi:hypothetical protein